MVCNDPISFGPVLMLNDRTSSEPKQSGPGVVTRSRRLNTFLQAVVA